jgi:hypothetical protein
MSVGGLDLMERLDRQGSLSIADQDVARENRAETAHITRVRLARSQSYSPTGALWNLNRATFTPSPRTG